MVQFKHYGPVSGELLQEIGKHLQRETRGFWRMEWIADDENSIFRHWQGHWIFEFAEEYDASRFALEILDTIPVDGRYA